VITLQCFAELNHDGTLRVHKRRKRTPNEATHSTALDATKQFLEEAKASEEGQFEDAEGQEVTADQAATEEHKISNIDVIKVEDQESVKPSNEEVSVDKVVEEAVSEEKIKAPSDIHPGK